MCLNRITLIGFIFSLATKTSWKNDAGAWESCTEWHRCVAFGKLTDFALPSCPYMIRRASTIRPSGQSNVFRSRANDFLDDVIGNREVDLALSG